MGIKSGLISNRDYSHIGPKMLKLFTILATEPGSGPLEP
jgi:hypothetical protein